jgi:1-acyl-sn-glycerol-3-phosphate acyltransferase
VGDTDGPGGQLSEVWAGGARGRTLRAAERRKRLAQPPDPRLYALARLLARLLFWLCVGPAVAGREHVPAAGPLLVVGNHLTFLEPPLLTAVVPRRMTFLALVDIFSIGWMAPFLRPLGALPVKQGGARDLDALRAALEILRHGGAVTIFPEGTRSLDGGLLRANPGVALLALRSGAPVLPVAVVGTERIEAARPFLTARLRGRRVRVVIGRPFRPTVGPGKPDHQAVADQIMGEVARLLPPAYRGAYADAAPEAGDD